MMACRSCNGQTLHRFINLEAQPPSNAFLTNERLDKPETYFPLSVSICPTCFLAQVEHDNPPDEIFNSEYVYFSRNTPAFVDHAKTYVDHITEMLSLDENSFVVEAASNDGYLLQFFKEKGVPHLGIEPSGSTAKVAKEYGINTQIDFFNVETAKSIVERDGKADLFLGKNVFAHVPDLNDFIGGISNLLADEGVATLEFPHLLTMMSEMQFDTIYHEHFSYISLGAAMKAMARHGLKIFRVEQQPVHGGSIRIFCAKSDSSHQVQDSVEKILALESDYGLDALETYKNYQQSVDALCLDFMSFIIDQKKQGKKIAGYGAAAKGNTFLNYCGVKQTLIDFVCDVTEAKQGKYLPGSRIPVFGEEKLAEEKPDYIVILPWNWEKQIIERLSYTREWGAKFIVAIPELRIT